jgi:hypothetical protein
MNNLMTLTSLAMLKVNEDAERRDYLEYLRPFVLAVLANQEDEEVSDAVVADALRKQFGLRIPDRAVHLVLRRFTKKRLLRKQHGVFYVVAKIEIPELAGQKAEAKRHIEAIARALVAYSQDTEAPLADETVALDAMIMFLAEFSVECLRCYVFNTVLPAIPQKKNRLVVLVSKFVRDIYTKNESLWDSFTVLVKGHMLANALTCPDLESLQQTFRRTTFYLDTPFVVRLLGLEGEDRERAANQTLQLARNLGGRLAIFEHTYAECYRVITGAASHIDSQDGRGSIVFEMRKQGRTFTDLILIAERLDVLLDSKGVKEMPTPKYEIDLQIDEIGFENVLDDQISYYNDKAREYDVNSVRSIYVLRAGKYPHRLEDAHAVMVTSNAAFAKAAFQYGRNFESTREVSSVITDFSLANIAWLKSPLDNIDLPKSEVLSLSYAALNPPEKLWNKYIREIDKLKEAGEITPKDHAMLKYGSNVREELVNLTLGEEESLTKQTVTQLLDKALSEHAQEIQEKLTTEQLSHDHTRDNMRREITQRVQLEKKVCAMVTGISNVVAGTLFILCALVVVVLLYLTTLKVNFVIPAVAGIGLATLAAGNLIWGVTLRTAFYKVRDSMRKLMLSCFSLALTNGESIWRSGE